MCIRVLLSRSFIASGTANYGSVWSRKRNECRVSNPNPTWTNSSNVWRCFYVTMEAITSKSCKSITVLSEHCSWSNRKHVKFSLASLGSLGQSVKNLSPVFFRLVISLEPPILDFSKIRFHEPKVVSLGVVSVSVTNYNIEPSIFQTSRYFELILITRNSGLRGFTDQISIFIISFFYF